jgi:hypothetical protein
LHTTSYNYRKPLREGMKSIQRSTAENKAMALWGVDEIRSSTRERLEKSTGDFDSTDCSTVDQKHRQDALMIRGCRPVMVLADWRRPWFAT